MAHIITQGQRKLAVPLFAPYNTCNFVKHYNATGGTALYFYCLFVP